MSTSVTALRLLQNRAMLDRVSADLDVVAHASFVDRTLDYVAVVIVTFEPGAGPAETMIAGLVGGLLAGTVAGLPLSGVATTLTLLVEKGIDAELVGWARARLAAEKGT